MTAIIDRRPQTTMSGDEVSLRTTFSAPSTSLSEGDVYFALPAWAPTPHLIAPQPRLRPSLFDPVARLAELMPNWDGYQGKPPSAAVLKMTIRVLAALPPQVPDPEVLPSTDGGVLLEWDMSGVELLLGLDDQALHTAVVSIDGSGEQEGPAVGLHDAIVDALVTLADRA
jgi:hypothetical protein